MQPQWQKYYNFLVLLASRGIGSILITSMFLIKKYFLPASEFGMLGHAFATVMVVASPLASPAIMLISRRIIQTRDLGRDRSIILGWSVLAFIGAAYATVESAFATNGVSTAAFYTSITAFVFVTVLNAQYIIWLNESDRTKHSLFFIAIFIFMIPLSILVRHISGIGQEDRSFSVEALLLSIPVMIDILRTKATGQGSVANLYDFSLNTYSKYFIIVLFYQGILWVDWTIGQHLLPAGAYIEWAGDRILLERILLPVLNIAQVTLLWHFLRSSTGKGQQNNESLSSQSVKTFFGVLVSAALLSILSWVFGSYYHWVHMLPFVIGYLAFGLTSIFLEFYQAKFSVKYLLITLSAVTAARVIIIGLVFNFAHTNDYAVAWALTSIAILFFVFRMSYDQIKVGKS
jgi:hypothetical protein